MAGSWIEVPELADPLCGVPNSTVRSDDNAVRSRCGRRRRVVANLPGSRVEPPNEAVLLVRIPDDTISADCRIVREGLVTRYLILDDCERRRRGGDQSERGNELGEAAYVPGNHFTLLQCVLQIDARARRIPPAVVGSRRRVVEVSRRQ